NTIKAIQTRGRSGISLDGHRIELPENKNKEVTPTFLDLNYLGVGNEKTKDDLKRIEGIGPFIEKKLNSIGIFTFEQLSKLRENDIIAITELIEFFPGRIQRDQWKKKAEKHMINIRIFSIEQLNKLRENDIIAITELIEFFPGRIQRDQWKKKAEKLLSQNSKSHRA